MSFEMKWCARWSLPGICILAMCLPVSACFLYKTQINYADIPHHAHHNALLTYNRYFLKIIQDDKQSKFCLIAKNAKQRLWLVTWRPLPVSERGLPEVSAEIAGINLRKAKERRARERE